MLGPDIDSVALRLVESMQGAAASVLSWTEILDPFPQGTDDTLAVIGLAQVALALTVVLMNALSQAVFVVDAKGCVLLLNRLASQLVARKDALTMFNRVLRAVSPSDTALLHRLIAKACPPKAGNGGTASYALRLEGPSGNGPLPVVVTALPEMRWTQPNRPVAVVLAGNPVQELETDPEALRRWYNLTAAEARVGALLGQGCTVGEVAELLNVQPNTVRVQLRAVFAKTGTSRQADLVRLLTSLPRR